MDILQVLEGATYMAFIVGAIVAVFELRTMSRDRKTEMKLRSMELFCSREMEEAVVNAVKANMEPGKVPDVDAKMLADYWDGVAQMARERLITFKQANDLLDFEGVWEWMKPWVASWEERVGKNRFSDFEWMAGEQRRRRIAAEKAGKDSPDQFIARSGR